MVAFFIISFIISAEFTFFYVYLTEVYPTQVRVIAISVVTVAGGITTSLADLIITLCENAGFSVMIVFAIASFISILVSLKLPETFQTPPPDLIEELA
jgi:MFS family permease